MCRRTEPHASDGVDSAECAPPIPSASVSPLLAPLFSPVNRRPSMSQSAGRLVSSRETSIQSADNGRHDSVTREGKHCRRHVWCERESCGVSIQMIGGTSQQLQCLSFRSGPIELWSSSRCQLTTRGTPRGTQSNTPSCPDLSTTRPPCRSTSPTSRCRCSCKTSRRGRRRSKKSSQPSSWPTASMDATYRRQTRWRDQSNQRTMILMVHLSQWSCPRPSCRLHAGTNEDEASRVNLAAAAAPAPTVLAAA